MCLAHMSTKGLFEAVKKERVAISKSHDNLKDIYDELRKDVVFLSDEHQNMLLGLRNDIIRISVIN